MAGTVLAPDGVFPSCAWHEDALWTIVRLGDPRVAGPVALYRDSLIVWSLELPKDTPTYPDIHSFDGTLWIAWNSHGAGVLMNVTTGARIVLSPNENNRPIVFGFQWCAWQGAQRDGWPITRVRLDSGVQSVGGVGSGTGLSRIDTDGACYSVDKDRHAFAGATIPCWSGDLVVGEGPTGGVRWQLTTGQQGTLFHGTTTFEPRCAVDGDRYAIVTAGAPHGVRVWRGTRAALIATMTAPIDPPPPICGIVYVRGEGGACPRCGHPKSAHTLKEPPVSVPDKSAFARDFLGPRLALVGSMDDTRAHTFTAVNAGCVELRKTDRKWGLLEKTGGDRVQDRAADIWLYDLGDSTAQVVDVVANGEGAPEAPGGERKPPSPAWSVKDIRPISQWREPFGGVIDPPPPQQTHRYDGGGNDTGICDRCQKPRADAIHAIPESKGPHQYDGGEQDTGLCDICGLAGNAPFHTSAPPPPVGDFVTKAQMQAGIAALQAAMRSEFNAALLEMRAALEREIAASGGVSANTVDVLIAKALSQLVVVGSTARVFSHAHSFTAQVTRKP